MSEKEMTITERLRQGIDPADIPEAEAAMDKGADEIERLRARVNSLKGMVDWDEVMEAKVRAAAADEIERLRAELQMVAGKLLGLRAATIEECMKAVHEIKSTYPNGHAFYDMAIATIRALAKEEK
jgi:archaellum component FlaC